MFLTMSIWGYTTKKSLAKMGSFLMMGLIGLIIASIVNIFLGSSALQFAMSIIGVIIFAGLTAYDTQVIKEIYVENENSEDSSKKAVMGALKLYLDLLLLFQYLLMLLVTGNKLTIFKRGGKPPSFTFFMSYDQVYNDWKKNPEEYWKKKASLIDWYKIYEKVLTKDKTDNFIWFKGGKLNTCYNCLDRHVENGLAKRECYYI